MWRHVTPGDSVRFQSPLENAKRDAANAEQQRQQGDTNARPDRRREQDVVRIENLTGLALARGDIVALGNPVILPSADIDSWWHRPLFQGNFPIWQPQWTYPGRIAVMLEPCATNAVASAVVSGCVHAQVNVRDINHEYADVDWTAGGIRLTSTDAGSACVQILSIEPSTAPAGLCGTGSDVRWAYVRMQNGGAFTFVGKVQAAVGPYLCGATLPPQGRVQIYWLDPTTGILAAVLDRQGNAIFCCPYNNECRPVAKDDFVRIHCDRWAVWWMSPQEPVTAMLRAYECIKPGETGKKAFVMRQSVANTGYELDPAYTAQVDVDNTDCLIFAAPGDLFSARRDGCCQTMWIPNGESGLTRRVRIDECLDCKAKGTATVLASTCESAECDSTDTVCTIQVCNTSGRPIAPCGPEEATAFLRPKNRVSGTECCWSLVANPYPDRAKAKLAYPLCPWDTDVMISSVTFPNFCGTWPKPTTAKNPYGLPGCADAACELAPSFDGCTCNWEIVQVQPKLVTQLVDDVRLECTESSCTLEKKLRKNVVVWSCDETVCVDSEWEIYATGGVISYVDDFDTTQSAESCGVTASRSKVCVFGCPLGPDTDLDLFELEQVEALVGMEPGTGTCPQPTLYTQKFWGFCVDAEESFTGEGLAGAIVAAGECISVEETTDEDGCKTYTVNNTMAVVGGDGIRVSESDCVYSISLDDNVSDPKVTLRLLCGVELSPITITCVESSAGWAFEVTGGEITELYTWLTLPKSTVEYITECDSSGSSGGEGPYNCSDCSLTCAEGQELAMDPITGECRCISGSERPPAGWIMCTNNVYDCADCPETTEGYSTILNMLTGECDEIPLGPGGQVMPPPEGWMNCTPPLPPSGEGISLDSLDCDGSPPHFVFTFLGMPAGATNFRILVTGDQGSVAQVGPSGMNDEVIGQSYWGALVEGWGTPQPEEKFSFVAQFMDDDGVVVSTQNFAGFCPPVPEL